MSASKCPSAQPLSRTEWSSSWAPSVPAGLLAIAVMANVACAGVPAAVDQYSPAICQVKTSGGWSGSGCYLGKGMVLTASHVVRDDNVGTCSFWRGPTVNFRVLRKDANQDTAVLVLDRELSIKAPSFAAKITPGEQLWPAGYSKDRLLYFPGPAGHQYAGPREGDWCWYRVRNAAIPGDSGGPVFNSRGELLGNLWGSDGSVTTAVRPVCVRRFLLPWNARSYREIALGRIGQGGGAPNPGGRVEFAPGSCPGGACPPTQTNPDPPRQPEPIAGPQGPQGPAGPPGQITDEHIAEIVTRVALAITSDPNMRGPQGPQGEPGAPATDRGSRLLTVDYVGPSGDVVKTETIDIDRQALQIFQGNRMPAN